MMYGGYEPKAVGCGNVSLREFTKTSDACRELNALQNLSECTPKFESQFGSLAEEVGLVLLSGAKLSPMHLV